LASPLDIADLYDQSTDRKVNLLDSEQDALPFDRIFCPDLITIGRAWSEMPCEPGEDLPRWSCFKPFSFKSCLDKMCVISVEDWRANALEFTLYGEHPTEFVGLGRPLSLQALRHDPQRRVYFDDIRDRVGRAIDHNAPQYARKTLSWNDRGFIEYEILMLPFQPNEGVQRILQPLSARIELNSVEV